MDVYKTLTIIGVISIVSFLTTFLVKKIAEHVNAIDVPNKRSTHTLHTNPVPRMGGLGIFIALLVACLFFIDISKEIMSILMGSFIIIVAGIIDDIKPIKARYKFLLQTLGALIVVLYGGIYFTNISLFGFTLNFHEYIGQFLSLFFILSVINAVNLIDGLDGLATGISLIYFLTIGVVAIILNKLSGLSITLTIVMIGGTLGFLIHNFPMAKIFLGDTGSMFLGFIIPIVAILGLQEGIFTSILTPIIILGIPIADTVFAILRRLINRKKVYSADKKHFHHQVLKLNLPLYASVLILYGVSILFSTLAVLYVIRSLIPFIILTIILLSLLITVICISDVLFDRRKKTEKKKNRDKRIKNKKAKKV